MNDSHYGLVPAHLFDERGGPVYFGHSILPLTAKQHEQHDRYLVSCILTKDHIKKIPFSEGSHDKLFKVRQWENYQRSPRQDPAIYGGGAVRRIREYQEEMAARIYGGALHLPSNENQIRGADFLTPEGLSIFEPQNLSDGPRRVHSDQPGAGALNWSPTTSIYDLKSSTLHRRIKPIQQFPFANNQENLTYVFEGGQGLFIDGASLQLSVTCKMMYGGRGNDNNAPVHYNTVAHAYRKAISVVNNIVTSMFKQLSITINDTHMYTFDYGFHDYFANLTQLTDNAWYNTIIEHSGFKKEQTGNLHEWNCFTGFDGAANARDPPVNTRNPARADLCKIFYTGEEVKLVHIIRWPFSESIHKVPINASNNIRLQFTLANPAEYILTGPDNADRATIPNTYTTVQGCWLQITNFHLDYDELAYKPKVIQTYLATYTPDNPDCWAFQARKVTTLYLNQTQTEFQFKIICDAIPDIAIALFRPVRRQPDKQYTRNKYLFNKFPAGTVWEFNIQNSSNWTYRQTISLEMWQRLKGAFLGDKDRLIITPAVLQPDDVPDMTSGYAMYISQLTNTQIMGNGTIMADYMTGLLTLDIKFPQLLDAPYEITVVQLSMREWAIGSNGQLIKDHEW